MDIRYLIVGFLSLILGLFFYATNTHTYLFARNQYFGIVIVFAIILGIVLIIVGGIEPDKQKKISRSSEDSTAMKELKKQGWINKKDEPLDILKKRYV